MQLVVCEEMSFDEKRYYQRPASECGRIRMKYSWSVVERSSKMFTFEKKIYTHVKVEIKNLFTY